MAVAKDEFNNIPDIREVIDYLLKHRVVVGVFGEDDSHILMVARVHEYGVDIEVTEAMRNYLHASGLHLREGTEEISIPERAFIRSGFDSSKEDFFNTAKHLIQQALFLEIPPETALRVIGEDIRNRLQEHMTDLSSPPNHPFTIKNKGSSNPLIDEGRLRSAITHKIVSG